MVAQGLIDGSIECVDMPVATGGLHGGLRKGKGCGGSARPRDAPAGGRAGPWLDDGVADEWCWGPKVSSDMWMLRLVILVARSEGPTH